MPTRLKLRCSRAAVGRQPSQTRLRRSRRMTHFCSRKVTHRRLKATLEPNRSSRRPSGRRHSHLRITRARLARANRAARSRAGGSVLESRGGSFLVSVEGQDRHSGIDVNPSRYHRSTVSTANAWRKSGSRPESVGDPVETRVSARTAGTGTPEWAALGRGATRIRASQVLAILAVTAAARRQPASAELSERATGRMATASASVT